MRCDWLLNEKIVSYSSSMARNVRRQHLYIMFLESFFILFGSIAQWLCCYWRLATSSAPCCPVVRYLYLKKTNHYKLRNFFFPKKFVQHEHQIYYKIFRFKHKNNLMFYGPCIVIYLRNKNQQNALFYSQFISITILYMFRAGLLLETCRG